MPSLVLVTLSYNNPEEARKTMASVALQSVYPSRYLVVDSSENPHASQIRDYSVFAHAEYHWVEGRGVYPAMNYALRSLADEDYVWFINSSDWLAGPQSVSIMLDALTSASTWVIGGLERLGDRRAPFHPIPSSGSLFNKLLSTGAIGFPHPATAMEVKTIRTLGGFDTSLSIAADYQLALGFASTLGVPEVVPFTLAVHLPTGLTSKNRFRHVWEKILARRRVRRTRLLTEVKYLLQNFSSYVGVKASWQTCCGPFPNPMEFPTGLDQWPGDEAPSIRPVRHDS